MKYLLLLLFGMRLTEGLCQPMAQSSWFPLDRVIKLSKYKVDTCDRSTQYPIQKIKILDDGKISLFFFNTFDPIVFSVPSLRKKHIIEILISNRPELPEEFYLNGKTILEISRDTIVSKTYSSKGMTVQRFIRKYNNIELNDYLETQLGSLFLAGNYVSSTKDSIKIYEDGRIVYLNNNLHKERRLSHYKFKRYSQKSCDSDYQVPQLRIAIKHESGTVKEYFIKYSSTHFWFFQIEGEKIASSHSIELLRIN